MAIRIYLIEDHALMREMLCEFMAEEDDLDVLGASGTGEEALDALGDYATDLVLVDTALPGMSGIEFVTAARSRWPELVCVMYSGHAEAMYVERALEAGARGYILKGSPDELPVAIRQVMNGATYLSEPLRAGQSTV